MYIFMWGKHGDEEKENGNSKSPKAHFYRVIKWNLSVCHHSKCHNFIILPTQCCAILGSVIFFPSLTSVCPRCLTNECVRKCFIFPSMDGEFITGSTSQSIPPLSHHALPYGRFWLRAEGQLIFLIWSCAQELKPCCSSLVWFFSLATDLNRTEKNASYTFIKTTYRPSPSQSVAKISMFCFVNFLC